MINSPGNVESCAQQYSFENLNSNSLTGAFSGQERFFSILQNNIYVMIFTLIFSLIFGAGAIFVLAWNSTVIASAVAIFTKYKISAMPIGLSRYMIHGLPEIAAYFITALAGGILGVGVIRHGIRDKRFVHILENVVILLVLAIIVLIIAGLLETYLTPLFFK